MAITLALQWVGIDVSEAWLDVTGKSTIKYWHIVWSRKSERQIVKVSTIVVQ